MNECPKPGIYEDIPFDTYLKWDAISNSRLKLATDSLAHYKAGWQGEESGAMRFGSLVHAGKLEPLEVAKRFAVMPSYETDPQNTTKDGEPSVSKSSKYYKFKKQEFLEANADKTIVEEKTYDEMIGTIRSLAQNEKAVDVLDGAGPVEVSIVWQDPDTGLNCKARFDKLQRGPWTVCGSENDPRRQGLFTSDRQLWIPPTDSVLSVGVSCPDGGNVGRLARTSRVKSPVRVPSSTGRPEVGQGRLEGITSPSERRGPSDVNQHVPQLPEPRSLGSTRWLCPE